MLSGMVHLLVFLFLFVNSLVLSQSDRPSTRILIYSATRAYRHESIPAAISALRAQGPAFNIQFDPTEDASLFTDETLAQYDALLFLSNSGEVLSSSGLEALQTYIDLGGNYVGIHGASAALFNSDLYRETVGALFDYHPPLQTATFLVLDRSHPSTSMLPERWTVEDEVYNFRSDPRAVGATVLLSVDASSYTDSHTTNYTDGDPHPVAWYQDRVASSRSGDGSLVGRSWYTSLGHLDALWQDELFLSHVMTGITWTLDSRTTRAFNPDGKVGTPANATASGSGPGPASAAGAPSSGSQATPTTSSAGSIMRDMNGPPAAALAAACAVAAFVTH